MLKSYGQSKEIGFMTGMSTRNMVCGINYRYYDTCRGKGIVFEIEEVSHVDAINPTFITGRLGFEVFPKFFASAGGGFSIISLDHLDKNKMIPAFSISYNILPSLCFEAEFLQYPQVSIKYCVSLNRCNIPLEDR
jgi:hypothetical protein